MRKWIRFAGACAVLMVFLCLTAQASDIISSGYCGKGVTYTLNSSGEFVISGQGTMERWARHTDVPWYNLRDKISTVRIADGVTNIGAFAFADCTALTEVDIGTSVVTIDRSAFENCIGLSSVVIPNGVTEIGDTAFDDCTALQVLTLPDSLTSIGYYTFYGCPGVKDYGNCGDTLAYVLHSNGELQITGSGTMDYWGSYAEPPWYGKRKLIKSIALSEGVTKIGKFAFCECVNLKEISIGENVKSIGESAFFRCSGLTFVFLEEGVQYIGNYAFEDNTALEAVILPESIKTIGTGAFAKCPAVLTYGSCGDTAAYVLYSNGDLHITGAGVMTRFDSGMDNYTNQVETVTIGGQIKNVGKSAFEFVYNELETVTIGDSVTDIWDGAFRYCSKLVHVTVGVNVTSIGDYAFLGCESLENVVIPDGVYVIGDSAFADCTRLRNLTLGRGVVDIGKNAFYKCSALEQVVYTGDLMSLCGIYFANYAANPLTYAENMLVGDEAVIDCGACGGDLSYVLFDYGQLCVLNTGYMTDWEYETDIPWAEHKDKITKVVLGGGVSGIGGNAFRFCSNLKDVIFTAEVSTIGDCAFQYCSQLAHVEFYGTQEEWEQISIGSENDALLRNASFKVPVSLYVTGIEEAYLDSQVKPQEAKITLSSGEIIDVTDLVATTCTYHQDTDQGVVVVRFGSLYQNFSVTKYSGAYAVLKVDNAHNATVKLFAEHAGQAIVAFYGAGDQMLSAYWMDMPLGSHTVHLEVKLFDLREAKYKIILLNEKGIPLCDVINGIAIKLLGG